jgi:hypothetical protein
VPEARLVSPNDMVESAKQIMLDGQEPVTEEDYAKVANFVAFNVSDGLEEPVLKLMKMMYEWPLEDQYLDHIATFQAEAKARGARNG